MEVNNLSVVLSPGFSVESEYMPDMTEQTNRISERHFRATSQTDFSRFEKRMRQIHTAKPLLCLAFLILNFEF